MLRNLRISGFRGLREFSMSGLGRVNLLVGTNNCGKTSVLEAIHMLSVPGSHLPLRQAQIRRGELIEHAERQIDVAHLVHGHRLVEGTAFVISGEGVSGRQSLTATLSPPESTTNEDEGGQADSVTPSRARASLRLEWLDGSTRKGIRLPLSQRGGIGSMLVPRPVPSGDTPAEVSFITTGGLTRDRIVAMFENVVLTPSEATVLQALRTVEPEIERLASIGVRASGSRGGLAIMVAGQRLPIGSLGDGIWRLLGIALALVSARGTVLLVDEIDTGLHYSVLVDMWRLVFETARSLDVQVFATTHSRDCYEALAAVAEPGRTEISLQRIERGKIEAVAFTELEIRQAAERGLEVR